MGQNRNYAIISRNYRDKDRILSNKGSFTLLFMIVYFTTQYQLILGRFRTRIEKGMSANLCVPFLSNVLQSDCSLCFYNLPTLVV